jgi:redox-sensing transcriptional repressor
MSLPSSTNYTNNPGKPEPEGKEPVSRDIGQAGSAHQARQKTSEMTSAADEASGAVKGLKNEIPRKAIYRLSMYLRCLAKIKEEGKTMVSSEALSKAAGVKPTQLRKDLTYFGKFGARGRGYDVEKLGTMISDLLGTTQLQPVILVGVGNLGLALMSYRGFEQEGFEILAAFDIDVARKRDKELSCPILPMNSLKEFVYTNKVRMAVLCVPSEQAQLVANELIRNGITGILNFAPVVLKAPQQVVVNNVNLAIELENLSYFVQEKPISEVV